jgi:hypothetical protein
MRACTERAGMPRAAAYDVTPVTCAHRPVRCRGVLTAPAFRASARVRTHARTRT